MLQIDDPDRVRLLAFVRPDALNALNDVLYDALTETLIDAEKREPEFTGI